MELSEENVMNLMFTTSLRPSDMSATDQPKEGIEYLTGKSMVSPFTGYFFKDKLEARKEDIVSMLTQFPAPFSSAEGEDMSQSVLDKNLNRWTNSWVPADVLVVVGQALGLVRTQEAEDGDPRIFITLPESTQNEKQN